MSITFTSVNTAAAGFIGIQNIGDSRVLAVTAAGELHRSADNGETWVVIGTLPLPTGSTPGDGVIATLLWSPGMEDLVFAFVEADNLANHQAGLLKSTDGGDSWVQVYGVVVGAWTDPELINAMVAISETHYLMSGRLDGVTDMRESVDSGDAWTTKAQTGAPAAYYDTQWLALVRLSDESLLLGTQDLFWVNPTALVYKSIDGGGTWSSISLPDSTPNQEVQEFAELTSGVVLAACKGGAWRSADLGDSWAQVFSTPGTVTAVLLVDDTLVLSAGGETSGVTWLSDVVTTVLISFLEFKPTASGWLISDDNGLTFSSTGVLPVQDANGNQSAQKMIAVVEPPPAVVLLGRTVYVPGQDYVYPWEANAQDFGEVGLRSLTFKVQARTITGRLGEVSIIHVSNPAPSMAGITVTATPLAEALFLDWSTFVIEDLDFDHFDVAIGYSADVASLTRIIRRGKDQNNVYVPDLPSGSTVYFQITPHDAFGPGTPTTIQSAVPL